MIASDSLGQHFDIHIPRTVKGLSNHGQKIRGKQEFGIDYRNLVLQQVTTSSIPQIHRHHCVREGCCLETLVGTTWRPLEVTLKQLDINYS